MFHLMHLLHLDFFGLGKKHRPYTLLIMGGKFSALFCQDGSAETDGHILSDLQEYLEPVIDSLADGRHELDYDLRERRFHGLSTRTKKYRVVRQEGDYPLLYDGPDPVDDDLVLGAFQDVLAGIDTDQIPADQDGFQIDFDRETGKFRGFGDDVVPEPQQGMTLGQMRGDAGDQTDPDQTQDSAEQDDPGTLCGQSTDEVLTPLAATEVPGSFFGDTAGTNNSQGDNGSLCGSSETNNSGAQVDDYQLSASTVAPALEIPTPDPAPDYTSQDTSFGDQQ